MGPKTGFCGTVVILALKKAPSLPPRQKTMFEEGAHNKLVFAFSDALFSFRAWGSEGRRRRRGPPGLRQCSWTRRVFVCKSVRVYESKSLRVSESKTLRIEVSKSIKARRVFDLDSRRVSGARGQRNGVGPPAKTGSCWKEFRASEH